MKRRIGLFGACVVSAAMMGAGPLVSTGSAAELVTKAPSVETPTWWYEGFAEIGGRFFLNNPQRDGTTYWNQNSLAKFYEYRDLRPGLFGDFRFAAHRTNPLDFEIWGKNVGYDDQSYGLYAAKVGEHYFNVGWDQTPHVYSTSARTPYLGLGSGVLTLPPGLPVDAPTVTTIILPYLYTTDIGIRRDTASADYRWTPSEAWDIKADYSHMHRTGTQIDGVVGMRATSNTSGFAPIQVPKPVDDTTQNYGLNGEYAGTSMWGKRYTFKLAYNGSNYSDGFSSYQVQNPWCTTVPCGGGGFQSPFARLGTWPSNHANAFSGTLAADLPAKSRYVGTVSYTMMRQNEAFNPMSNNPAAPAFVLPAASLNGAINTLLINNVVTTQITSELRSKLSYRLYDYRNNTPEILFPDWISYDSNGLNGYSVRSLSLDYTKQNAGAELTWRPTRQWNLGAAYGWEHYDWRRYDVTATNEHSGKVFADWKSTDQTVGVRSSVYYANRRYDNYDDLNNVAIIQNPTLDAAWINSAAYRQMMVNDRERWKANLAVDLTYVPGVTITPTFKYQDDAYGVDPATEMGLASSRMWSAGVDATYLVNPDTSFMVGYMRENYRLKSYGPALMASTNDRVTVDTLTALVRYAAIPDRLNLEGRYTVSHAVDDLKYYNANGTGPSGGQYPDVTSLFHRFDAIAKYTFDPAVVARNGFTGNVYVKLHYIWERNSVENWQQDSLTPTPSWEDRGFYMAAINPNYNVHMLKASLGVKW